MAVSVRKWVGILLTGGVLSSLMKGSLMMIRAPALRECSVNGFRARTSGARGALQALQEVCVQPAVVIVPSCGTQLPPAWPLPGCSTCRLQPGAGMPTVVNTPILGTKMSPVWQVQQKEPPTTACTMTASPAPLPLLWLAGKLAAIASDSLCHRHTQKHIRPQHQAAALFSRQLMQTTAPAYHQRTTPRRARSSQRVCTPSTPTPTPVAVLL